LAILWEVRREANKRLEGATLSRYVAADLRFHTLLLSAGGNRRIMKVVADSQVMIRLLAFAVKYLPSTSFKIAGFHGRILRAVRRGDADAARSLTAEHLRIGKQQMVEHFDQTRAAGQTGRSSSLALGRELLEDLNYALRAFPECAVSEPEAFLPLFE
ncbi:MAG: FCD domain-containing protein, partial [Planctomycetes bacterium]|nr:FCD domain-containing protein [Planctomycetota bacterium]